MSANVTMVDDNDNVIGPISKLEAHLQRADGEKSVLHRAFSLFLFNSENELLLQQRSHKKITFPMRWTNTCCSHNEHIAEELESTPDFIGMRRAAVRRVQFEFGITELDAADLKVVARIYYHAPSCD